MTGLKQEDAPSYLHQVKHEFADRPEVFKNFLGIMKQFKTETIDTSQVIRQISELFRGHPHLILGFNAFLPSDQRIQPNSLDLHPPSSAIDQSLPPPAITPNATSTPSQQIRPQNQGQLYLDQVKHQLTDQPELFKQFLSLMKAFQADMLNTRDVVRRIEVLFHGHPDLVTGFLTFLPPGDPVLEQVASTHHTQTT